jgi:hypothetical protein
LRDWVGKQIPARSPNPKDIRFDNCPKPSAAADRFADAACQRQAIAGHFHTGKETRRSLDQLSEWRSLKVNGCALRGGAIKNQRRGAVKPFSGRSGSKRLLGENGYELCASAGLIPAAGIRSALNAAAISLTADPTFPHVA